MPKTIKTKKQAAQIRTYVDTFIAQQSGGTYNYKQVSSAIGQTSPAAQRAVALYLAE